MQAGSGGKIVLFLNSYLFSRHKFEQIKKPLGDWDSTTRIFILALEVHRYRIRYVL